ncbi:dysbindin protein homolog [Drosophila busckii]|uniref:dysbindin protein homolog n=1 Tax=Drosophila busckii TaxID=30019 RepID=UPI00083EDCF7|nr:dysbindin protein homolog [Drosophila busckii]
MFGSLKKKLSNAIQEGIVISESLQQQYRQRVSSSSSQSSLASKSIPTTPLSQNESFTSSLNSTSTHSLTGNLADGVPVQLNVAAGCNLLAKYEDDWQVMHTANEENAARAASVATQITAVEHRASMQRATINDLNSCLAKLPELVTKLKASVATLQSMKKLGEQLEIELEKLEDLCEECELQEFMLEKQFELSRHKQNKLNSLEQYRQQIAAQHQEKIRAHEQHLRQIQKERNAVFDNAFQGDLQEYKQHGQLTKIQTKANNLSLEEVVLEHSDEEAKDALEQFLNG